MGLLDFLNKKKVAVTSDLHGAKDLDLKLKTMEEEIEKVNSSDDLTPESLNGKNRRYHYKDVTILVPWQYSGQYGKTYEDIGVRRGDVVDLQAPQQKTDDPEDISINWKGIDLGLMKNNRLRGMIHQWKSAKLPVLAIVSQVGGVHKLFIEISFYGYPKNTNKNKEK